MTNEIAKKDTTQLGQRLKIEDAPEMQPIEESEVLRIPRLMLIQDKHKSIKEGWAKPGELMNSLTKESYGKAVEVVAVYQRPLTRIRWAPRASGGGQMCISRNKTKPVGDPGDNQASCATCPFYSDHSPDTGCTMNHEIVSLVINGEDPRFWEPILLAAEYTRPSDAGIRNILEMARYNMNKGIRMFHKPFVIGVADAKNRFGDFYKTTCSPGAFGGKLNNGLLPLDVIDYLDQQVQFFKKAKLDDAEPVHDAEVKDQAPVIDKKTGAPANW